MPATHFADGVDALALTAAADIADFRLLDALAGDEKPSFIVRLHPRPSCHSQPVCWFNSSARRRLRLGRVPSNASTLPQTDNGSGLNSYSTSTSSNSGTGISTASLSQYDSDFHAWILNRLAVCPNGNGSGPAIPYYTCTKGILWTTTTLEAGGTQYLLFTGIPLSLKSPLEYDRQKARGPTSEISAQNLSGDDPASGLQSSSPLTDLRKDWGARRLSWFKPERWSVSLPGSPTTRISDTPDLCLERRPSIALQPPYHDRCGELTPLDPGPPARITLAYNEPEKEHVPVTNIDNSKAPSGDALKDPTNDMDHPNVSIIDWTRHESSDLLPEHTKLIRDYDWSTTPLGPIEDWPQSLRTVVVLMCASCFPSALYYGPDFTLIYNDPFKVMMSGMHPWGLGKPCREVWGDVFDDLLRTRFAKVIRGIPTFQEDHEVFMMREGITEQTFFSWTLNPIVDESGKCAGIWNFSVDLTARVVAARGFQMLGEIGRRTSGMTSSEEFWNRFLDGMQTNETDAPFALVYSRVSNYAESSSCSDAPVRKSNHDFTVEYEGSYNIPEGHVCRPQRINLGESDEGFAAAFREACDHEVLYLKGNSLVPPQLLEGLTSSFGDAVEAVAVCPIHSHSAADEISGFLVLGLNTRRLWNDDYKLFVELLIQQLSSALSASFFFEAEVRRSENLARIAAMEKIILSNQLAAKTVEARANESRFKRLTDLVPVGIYMCDANAKVYFVNDAWHEITAFPKGVDLTTWMDYVHPDDRDNLRAEFTSISERTADAVPHTFRWLTPYTTKDGQVMERWTFGSTQVEIAEDGSIAGYLGVTMNISEQKLREQTQKKRLEEATELKRQQDNFVDIASHEMRNPLSAILQLSDIIISSLQGCNKYYKGCDPQLQEEITAAIDAAQTILLCASHQKRVVDDILTLSKLDSARLMITPVDVQPVAIVNEAMKMFKQECLLHEISMELEVDEGYRNLSVDWVKLDPTRLLQVLINLLTNAIKFIRSEAERTITVTMSASLDKPVDPEGLMVFPSVRKMSESLAVEVNDSEQPEDSVFLSFEVKDSGRGLTNEEKKMLFQKFSQASPRTHIQYGGSGLGLFISRELVQLQCGEIGVLSEAGKGCAFCFYIKGSRGEPQGTEIPAYARTIAPGSHTRRSSLQLSSPFEPASRSGSPGVVSTVAEGNCSGTPDYKRLRGYQVLIVEDNLVNQKVVRKQLQKLGCNTHVANHGLEALEKVMQSKLYMKAAEDAYDLTVILMDVEMPIMDGLKATGEIRRLEAEGSLVRRIPIIAVTANARPEQIKQMRDAGMDDVLSKPFRMPELVSKLEHVLQNGGLTARAPS
ncbi:Hybrid signal transduction histidine kinase K [Drechslerella dactyloides]|uniref:Hybrid signal transduction histidine kinase K n=1 Tax=Drechslerella dactyloides TaxID=74499 RepID=A0AAD6J3V5_DREDA|nr:Hybrid signal transduction histidine kinase K [Drechslerella dactyloides]